MEHHPASAGEPMADDASYAHSDLRRVKELLGWGAAIVALALAAGGWVMTVQRDIHDLQGSDAAMSVRISDVENNASSAGSRLERVEGKLDIVISLLQGSATEPARPQTASRR